MRSTERILVRGWEVLGCAAAGRGVGGGVPLIATGNSGLLTLKVTRVFSNGGCLYISLEQRGPVRDPRRSRER